MDESWRADAACIGSLDTFFPNVKPGGGNAAVYDEARVVCAGCPVFGDCLAWVRAHPQPDGVWAGMGPSERREDLKRQDRRLHSAPVRASALESVGPAR